MVVVAAPKLVRLGSILETGVVLAAGRERGGVDQQSAVKNTRHCLALGSKPTPRRGTRWGGSCQRCRSTAWMSWNTRKRQSHHTCTGWFTRL